MLLKLVKSFDKTKVLDFLKSTALYRVDFVYGDKSRASQLLAFDEAWHFVRENTPRFQRRSAEVIGLRICDRLHHSFFVFDGVPIYVSHQESEIITGEDGVKTTNRTLSFHVMYSDKTALNEIIEREILDAANQHNPTISFITDTVNTTIPLNLNFGKQRQFINANNYDAIDRLVNRFINNKQWYIDNLMPYKETILLSGPPGTGKTTLVKHFAAKYETNLFITTDPGMIDFDSRLQRHRICLLEDISDVEDLCVPPPKDENISIKLGEAMFKETKPSRFDYSTFINRLDGAVPMNNMLLFMTANNPERLKPSLVRKGRFDLKIVLDYLDVETVIDHLGLPMNSSMGNHLLANYQKGDIHAGHFKELAAAKTIVEIDNILTVDEMFDGAA